MSAYELNPFDVAEQEKQARMLDLSDRLLRSAGVSHTSASLWSVQENKYSRIWPEPSRRSNGSGCSPS